MHLNENFNGSYFTEESVTQAIPTLANTPIMGLIDKESNDFSDHGVELEINVDNGEITEKHLSVPYGVIPSENNAQFEERVGDDGITRKYLTVEGLLWNKWEDAVNLLNNGKPKGQSMEITEVEGQFNEDDYFNITKFKFDGACILGDDVLPAMINSTIETKFSNEVTNVIKEKLSVYTMYTEGGKEVPKKKDEEKVAKGVTAQSEGGEDTGNEELPKNEENPKGEEPKDKPDEGGKNPEEPKEPEQPSKPEPEKPEEKEKGKNVDLGNSGIIISDEDKKPVENKKAPNHTELGDKEGVLGQIVVGDKIYTQEDIEQLVEIQEKYEAVLREQHIEEAKEQINKFADLLTEEQITGLSKDLEGKDIEDLTKEIYAFVGMNSINKLPKEDDKEKTAQFTKVGVTVKSESDDPYGNIIRKK